MKTLWIIIAGARSAWAAAREIDTALTGKFTPLWWVHWRANIERRIVWAYDRRDRGVLKLIKVDNAFLLGLLLLLKSNAVYAIYQSLDESEQAHASREALAKKDPRRTMKELKAAYGGEEQPRTEPGGVSLENKVLVLLKIAYRIHSLGEGDDVAAWEKINEAINALESDPLR
jgi:hypothetical protein